MPPDVRDARLVGDRHIDVLLEVELVELEGRAVRREHTPAEGVLAGLAVVEEVGRREERRDGLDPAGSPPDGVERDRLPLRSS